MPPPISHLHTDLTSLVFSLHTPFRSACRHTQFRSDKRALRRVFPSGCPSQRDYLINRNFSVAWHFEQGIPLLSHKTNIHGHQSLPISLHSRWYIWKSNEFVLSFLSLCLLKYMALDPTPLSGSSFRHNHDGKPKTKLPLSQHIPLLLDDPFCYLNSAVSQSRIRVSTAQEACRPWNSSTSQP